MKYILNWEVRDFEGINNIIEAGGSIDRGQRIKYFEEKLSSHRAWLDQLGLPHDFQIFTSIQCSAVK